MMPDILPPAGACQNCLTWGLGVVVREEVGEVEEGWGMARVPWQQVLALALA
jgi:hypothetical protein